MFASAGSRASSASPAPSAPSAASADGAPDTAGLPRTSQDVPLARPAVDPADPAAPLTNRKVAAAYVASVCFKHGPPRLLGTELEWLVRHTDRPDRPLDPAVLSAALGPYTPHTLRSRPGPAPLAPTLPAGCSLTVEPGGQVEIASPPRDSLAVLIDTVAADLAVLRRRLHGAGLELVRRAGDPLRPPRRLLDVPRYAAMEASFDRIGPHGRTMMCSTSAVQVCLDAGEGPEVARRWAAMHELGPVLCAAFANSPSVHGRRTGWKSSRMASWLALDPARTRPPTSVGDDPASEYAERALATALLCRPSAEGSSWVAPRSVTFDDWIEGALGAPPTRADLDYHLTTMFPPVRPQGHLELRYIDQQPGDEWVVPVAVVSALFSDPAVLGRARAAAAPATGRWSSAARHGLADRVLRRAAGEVFEIAHRALRAPQFDDLDGGARDLVDRVITERVLRGRCPADDSVGEPGEDALAPCPAGSGPGGASAEHDTEHDIEHDPDPHLDVASGGEPS